MTTKQHSIQADKVNKTESTSFCSFYCLSHSSGAKNRVELLVATVTGWTRRVPCSRQPTLPFAVHKAWELTATLQLQPLLAAATLSVPYHVPSAMSLALPGKPCRHAKYNNAHIKTRGCRTTLLQCCRTWQVSFLCCQKIGLTCIMPSSPETTCTLLEALNNQ